MKDMGNSLMTGSRLRHILALLSKHTRTLRVGGSLGVVVPLGYRITWMLGAGRKGCDKRPPKSALFLTSFHPQTHTHTHTTHTHTNTHTHTHTHTHNTHTHKHTHTHTHTHTHNTHTFTHQSIFILMYVNS